MKNLNYFRRVVAFLILVLFLIFSACNEEALTDDSVDATFSETDGVGLSSDISSGGTRVGSSDGQGIGGDNSGLVTAGEWNDLENWIFGMIFLMRMNILKIKSIGDFILTIEFLCK